MLTDSVPRLVSKFPAAELSKQSEAPCIVSELPNQSAAASVGKLQVGTTLYQSYQSNLQPYCVQVTQAMYSADLALL